MPGNDGSAPERKLALLFPGQGSQHPGMGRRIHEISSAARRVFAQADEVLGFRLSRLCFEGPEEELENTINTQPAILATSMAYLAFMRERLEELGKRRMPSLVAGHSLGQFTAAVASGALDFADGLRLVVERARIMAEWARSRPGGLASILGLNSEDVERVCQEASGRESAWVAVVNAPGQTVIAGETSALQRAMALAHERGAKVLRLPIGVPGHSPVMRDAARELSRFISTLKFRDPQPPLVSNISAQLVSSAEDVRQELSEQICAAVQWAGCFLAMLNEGTSTFVEVGPGHALSRIARRIHEGVRVVTLHDGLPDELLSAGLPEVQPAKVKAIR